MTAVAAAIKHQRRMTTVAIDGRINCKGMMNILGGQRIIIGVGTPVVSIVTGRTTGDISGITVTGVTVQSRVGQSQIVVLLLIGSTRSMTVLTIGRSIFHINDNAVVAVIARQSPSQEHMMAISRFTLVTIVAV